MSISRVIKRQHLDRTQTHYTMLLIIAVTVIILLIVILISDTVCREQDCTDIQFVNPSSNVLLVSTANPKGISTVSVRNNRTGKYLSYLRGGKTVPLLDAPYYPSYNVVWLDDNMRHDSYEVKLNGRTAGNICSFKPEGTIPSKPTDIRIIKK